MSLFSKKINKIYVSLSLILVGVFLTIWITSLSPLPIFSKAAPLSTESTKAVPIKVVARNTITEDPVDLQKYLTVEAALLGVSDNISLYFKDENQNREITIDPERSWIPASTIKAYVVLEAFRQRRIGLIDFNTPITITAGNVVPTELETEEFPRLREGSVTTIKQLVEAMIIQSDNTAYNTLIDVLDRRNINQTLRVLGITETAVGEKLNLDDNQFQQDLTVAGRQSNTTTVKDLGTFFNLLYSKQIADADEILAIFKRQKLNNMIPALLPSTVDIAHKTGDWAPIYHDGGVVFKPSAPFTLVVFTNANDVNVLSQLARVAYYQTADSVGRTLQGAKPTDVRQPKASGNVYLASAALPRVLGQQTSLTVPSSYVVIAGDSLYSIAGKLYGNSDSWPIIARRNYITDPATLAVGQKLAIPSPSGALVAENISLPKVTAADLGITTKDLSVGGDDSLKIPEATVAPGNPLYIFKLGWENFKVATALNTFNKINAYLEISRARLSEIKSRTKSGSASNLEDLFSQSEKALKSATELAKTTDEPQYYLLQVKQLTSLHYEILAENITQVTNPVQKEKVLDQVYGFYHQNQKEVAPVVRSFVSANPVQQEPIIGTVVKVEANKATIAFDNGATKDVLLTNDTPTRDFKSDTKDSTPTIKLNSRIAISGQVGPKGHIIPSFILRNIPKNLPDHVTGEVVEVNPGDNSLKVKEQNGETKTIMVTPKTVIESKDTSVSLEGIKAGSSVNVVTTATSSAVSTNNLPVNASSIKVTKNSSGSDEKVKKPEPKKAEPKKPEPKKPDQKSPPK